MFGPTKVCFQTGALKSRTDWLSALIHGLPWVKSMCISTSIVHNNIITRFHCWKLGFFCNVVTWIITFSLEKSGIHLKAKLMKALTLETKWTTNILYNLFGSIFWAIGIQNCQMVEHNIGVNFSDKLIWAKMTKSNITITPVFYCFNSWNGNT